jgi:hypothetical protein
MSKSHEHDPGLVNNPAFNHFEALLHLHITEYNALTTRNNNWVTIQVGIWSLILLYATVASTVWTYSYQSKPEYGVYIIWGSSAFIQIALAILYFTIQEVYRNVLYIETVLRGLIKDIVGNNQFWQYESFLARNADRKPAWTDSVTTCAVICLFVLLALLRHAYSFSNKHEFYGFIANIPFSIFLVWQTILTMRLRRKFQFPDKKE